MKISKPASALVQLHHCWAAACFCLGMLAGTSSLAAECKKIIVSADPAYPPLHWHDGASLQGASIEVTTRILDDLGLAYEVRYVGPWKRVLFNAEAGNIDMVVTLKNTSERRRYLDFTSNAAFANPIVVFVPRVSNFKFDKWDDLKGKRGGVTLGNKFGDGFDEFMEAQLTIDSAQLPEASFKKMALGRIDYFITGLYTGMAYILEHELNAEFTSLNPSVTQSYNYMGFVKSSPCIKHLPDFDRRLGELKRQGVVQTIVDRNFERWHNLILEKKRAKNSPVVR
ncbi:substrate-binding periplasmic protein [Undibacterium sp. Ren11W]|uniref:substrate-binding periplasmic protein n=1 Tax=Undibacterium sp. Ren11W TaxID=3413045 RepID=UPI003BEF79C3